MSLIVKICGITRLEDALEAAALGADALGFMFYERSSRRISVVDAESICRQLPKRVSRVGVFVDATRETIEAAIARCGLDFVQLHGSESPEFCASIKGALVIKAFRMADETSLDALGRYQTSFWLLDSHVPGAQGGTGITFNWELARKARALNTPFLLAGGLTPQNVGDAVKWLRPAGVDVSSGVESAPGKKDGMKMKSFIESVRTAAIEVDQEGLAKV